jgi:hypothetical protein
MTGIMTVNLRCAGKTETRGIQHKGAACRKRSEHMYFLLNMHVVPQSLGQRGTNGNTLARQAHSRRIKKLLRYTRNLCCEDVPRPKKCFLSVVPVMLFSQARGSDSLLIDWTCLVCVAVGMLGERIDIRDATTFPPMGTSRKARPLLSCGIVLPSGRFGSDDKMLVGLCNLLGLYEKIKSQK